MLAAEDLAWVQVRLRDCRNVGRQLHICAQCLCLPDYELLQQLGYGSMADLKIRYQSDRLKTKPHGYGGQPANDTPVTTEAVLRYMGGADFEVVAQLFGCKRIPTVDALRVRVSGWKSRHPEFARRLPKFRFRQQEIDKLERMLLMEPIVAGLPPFAYAVSPYTHCIVRILRGETAFFGVKDTEGVDALNSGLGVSKAQAAAMYNGVLCGWDSPMADPDNYTADGVFVEPEMEVNNG